MEFPITLTKIQQLSEASNPIYTEPTSKKIKQLTHSFGQWSEKEVLKYFLFVYHHKQKFGTKSMRKSLKVFKQMAKFIKSRNSSQCRTHHQNLMNKSKNLQNALTEFIEKHPTFYDKYDSIKDSLNILDDLQFCEDTSTVIREAKQDLPSELQNSSSQFDHKINLKEYNKNIEPHKIQSMSVFNPKLLSHNNARYQKLLQFQILFNLWACKVASLTSC